MASQSLGRRILVPVRIITYNVHSCVGTDAQLSVRRVAQVIARAEADVVCLQEIDVGRRRTRGIDQARELAAALSMEVHFHPAIRLAEEAYGDAILSRHPLELRQAAALPTVPSVIPIERRGALWAAVRIDGVEWQVINTHFGLGRTERRVQARSLASEAWAGAVPRDRPLVVCGDFNSRPASRTISILGERLRDAQVASAAGHEATFATYLPVLCLDYVFVGQGVRIHRTEVIKSAAARVASDHYPLVADLSWSSEQGGEGT
jgi:endonuclease/exonuclease/phosphatase family metal-dependent hydrolase